MRNPFTIESSEYINLQEFKRVPVVYRFFIAVLDLTIFSFLASFTVTFLEKFTETENSESLPLIIFSFYSIIFIAIEYYFDGSLTKILFGIRNVRQGGKKIN